MPSQNEIRNGDILRICEVCWNSWSWSCKSTWSPKSFIWHHMIHISCLPSKLMSQTVSGSERSKTPPMRWQVQIPKNETNVSKPTTPHKKKKNRVFGSSPKWNLKLFDLKWICSLRRLPKKNCTKWRSSVPAMVGAFAPWCARYGGRRCPVSGWRVPIGGCGGLEWWPVCFLTLGISETNGVRSLFGFKLSKMFLFKEMDGDGEV